MRFGWGRRGVSMLLGSRGGSLDGGRREENGKGKWKREFLRLGVCDSDRDRDRDREGTGSVSSRLL